MPIYRPKVPVVPSGITGTLRSYLEQMASAINALPNASVFSGASPNSAVTGTPGDLAMNVGSASTQTRLWMMGGTGSALTNRGWVAVRVMA